MKPHWVNVCERKPEEGKHLQVLVARGTNPGTYDIDYGEAKLTGDGWLFSAQPQYVTVVAWLESDRRLSTDELSQVVKDRIRF
jgi:hypothetical protein